jgi:hypothetical protein
MDYFGESLNYCGKCMAQYEKCKISYIPLSQFNHHKYCICFLCSNKINYNICNGCLSTLTYYCRLCQKIFLYKEHKDNIELFLYNIKIKKKKNKKIKIYNNICTNCINTKYCTNCYSIDYGKNNKLNYNGVRRCETCMANSFAEYIPFLIKCDLDIYFNNDITMLILNILFKKKYCQKSEGQTSGTF